MTDSTTEREAFEAKYKPIYDKEGRDWPQFINGRYMSLLQLQWEGWQARAQIEPVSQSVEPKDDLIKRADDWLNHRANTSEGLKLIRDLRSAIAERDADIAYWKACTENGGCLSVEPTTQLELVQERNETGK